MAARKSSSGPVGGILVFLGSLVYLYLVFTWYMNGMAFSTWLSATQFFGPFVVAVAIVSAISLFFMGTGAMANMAGKRMRSQVLWKFVMLGAITLLIVTGNSVWFYAVLLGFILTYLGAAISDM